MALPWHRYLRRARDDDDHYRSTPGFLDTGAI
jgi:hypothetical protein